jgi:hypothetical protein
MLLDLGKRSVCPHHVLEIRQPVRDGGSYYDYLSLARRSTAFEIL